MNPERMAMQNIDKRRERREELSLMMQGAYEKARTEVLSNPEHVIQEQDFCKGPNPVYHASAVQSDLEYVKRREREFDANHTLQDKNTIKVAETLEAIILMQSEMSEWLGSNATTMKTARFDDIANKVDMIAEWSGSEGSSVLALGVDVTFGATTIENKINTIKEEIDRGKLGTIRYFKDSQGDFMGTRNNVPRTIIGISHTVVEDLARLWIQNDKKALGEHPVQRALLSQIGTQLFAMRAYALKRENYVVAAAYDRPLAVLKRIRENKAGLQLGDLQDDPVWKEITAQTKAQFAV